jgi:diadenosine tetraphosphatase ApaH/serine/threonine PP2A family protein phosphatase
LASVQQIAAAANGISASLLLCGHSHLPRVVALPDGRLIVNPGSVGLPAYDDDHPYPHRVENGSPHARYAICERGGDGWRIDLRAVPYDFRAAAQLAGENGAPDWARWLSSGWVAQ